MRTLDKNASDVKVRKVAPKAFDKSLSLGGPQFNAVTTNAPLNKSTSKASFAFSRAKRFSNVSVNEAGFAITMIGG